MPCAGKGGSRFLRAVSCSRGNTRLWSPPRAGGPGVTLNGDPAPARRAAGPAGSMSPSLWGRETAGVAFMDRGWTGLRGDRGTGGAPTGGCLSRGCLSDVDVAPSPRCPDRPAWWTSVWLSLPHFHAKGRRDVTWGPAAAICSWRRAVLRAGRPKTRVERPAGAEGQGEEGLAEGLARRAGSEGRGCRGLRHHLWPSPPTRFWAQSGSRVPLPAQGQAVRCSPCPALLAAGCGAGV